MAADGIEMVAPAPRSPPKYPDFCGRRRLQLEVQTLNREVGFLQEELQSLEGLQPVSRCCKEVHEFVGTNPDPLVPPNKKKRKSCRFFRWLGSKLCCCLSCICCCTDCKKPTCTCCPSLKDLCCCNCNCFSCCKFPRPCCCNCFSCCNFSNCCCSLNPCCCCKPSKCCSCSCCETSCCKMPKSCCCSPTISCPEYSCGCVFDCPKCTEVRLCPKCSKPCCVTGCLC